MERKTILLIVVLGIQIVLAAYMYITSTVWRPLPPSKPDSPTPFNFTAGLTFQCVTGQLGNRMFFYAIVYGLSRLNNRKGFIQRCNLYTCDYSVKDCKFETLDEIFEFSLPIGPDLPRRLQRGHAIHFHSRFPEDYRIAPDANILIGEIYPLSVTHFLHVREEVRREFRFRKPFQEYAQNFLEQVRGSRKDVTYVGVHVRRRDYLDLLQNYHKHAAPLKFYQYGLAFFRSVVRNAIFIVLSDDISWCREYIVGNDVYVSRNVSSPAQDLAVLSSCQHVLFDYGTYGLWGALLAGGKTMYFADGIVGPTEKDPTLGRKSYPPEWIGVSNAMLKTFQKIHK